MYTASLIWKAETSTGEGAIWHPERKSLFWVDIEGKMLYEYIPGQEKCNEWNFNKLISTVVPETKTSVVVALQNEIVRVNLTNENWHSIAKINDRRGTVRCNDGKCDAAGRLWIGTITQTAPEGSATLYTVLHDGTVTKQMEGVTMSNGIVWSKDNKRMYYIDTPTRQIAAYRFDLKTGCIELEDIVVTIPEGTGKPDGMTIDENDNLWVAQWGGYGVYCYHPVTGELMDRIEVPVPNTPSCAFGGENLDTLYITSARQGMKKNELELYPDSGSLFACKPGVKGVRANYFTK
ncbi:MAG: SMP-30/gluconolactonase/LRE family protein [Tannerellaceae bacterium]|nr:SMP-30/gluconolactonase/LRE family protein [Tannerellaceae bacterium]